MQTEVIYEELPPSFWRASVKFIAKDEWENTLSDMLDDLEAYMDGINSDSGPAMNAWEILTEPSRPNVPPTLPRHTCTS